MFRWTIKSLVSEPLNFFLTSLVVGIALLLVIFFEAVFHGESQKIIAYPQNINPDVWVMQRGVFNMHMATSFIWDWKKDRVEEVEGVADVTPILYLNSIVEAGSRHWFSFVVGLKQGNKRAGPWSMATGSSHPGKGEAIIPELLGMIANVMLGDTIRIANKTFTIVGFSKDTFSMANSIAFISYADLRDIMSLSGSDSYLLVDAEPGVDPSLLAQRIKENVSKVNALTSAEFIKNDRELALQMGVELIGIMTIVGTCLAVSLVIFMLYMFMEKRRRDIAILKALGFGKFAIISSAIIQAFCITMTGLVTAVILMYTADFLTDAFYPQVSMLITPESLMRVGLVSLLIAVLASLIPICQTMKVDPLLAFQR